MGVETADILGDGSSEQTIILQYAGNPVPVGAYAQGADIRIVNQHPAFGRRE